MTRICALISFFTLAAGASAAPPSRPPNILLILADDLGREWISCYGSECMKTPAIDNLARNGMRFTNVWATPLCSPTRVELLTGRYPFRTGWTVHHDSPRWGGQYFDWRREITFARMLKSAGYATAIAGKWQINDLRVQRDALQRHGFDEHCVWPGFETGNPISDSRYYDPYLQINGERRVHKGEFGPDVCSEFLIDFMRRHRDRPFLAYDSMLLVHGPNTTTPANRNAKEKGGALYPGMTAYLDDIVGREIRALDELGLRDNTIVIFCRTTVRRARTAGPTASKSSAASPS